MNIRLAPYYLHVFPFSGNHYIYHFTLYLDTIHVIQIIEWRMPLSVMAPHRVVEHRNNMAVPRNRHRTDQMKRNQLLIGLFCATSGSEGMSFASSRSIAVGSPFIVGNLFIYYVTKNGRCTTKRSKYVRNMYFNNYVRVSNIICKEKCQKLEM